MQSTRLEFVINLTTAKTLGLTFPPGLCADTAEPKSQGFFYILIEINAKV